MHIHSLPLIIGVTGHRDIPHEDMDVMRDAILQQLQAIQNRHEQTPLLILSGLAEGADRLVVELALSIGIEFAAVLPLEMDDYMNDFESTESKCQFKSLLAQAKWVSILPKQEEDERNLPHRERCYEQLGYFLVRHAQILIALWDGDHLEKTGGTSQVVRYFLQNIDRYPTKNCFLLENNQFRPVIHIHTRRENHAIPQPKELAGNINVIWPDTPDDEYDWYQRQWQGTLTQQGSFNTDMKEICLNYPDKIEKSLSYLLGDSSKLKSLSHKERVLAEFFAICDSLSSDAQLQRRKNFRYVVIFAFAGVVSQQCYGFFLLWQLLLLNAGLILVAFLFYKFGNTRRFESKYLDYRALAEGLRIQFFWQTAGMNDTVADHFIFEQRDELDWIQNALQSFSLGLVNESSHQSSEWILEHWIRDQRTYFVGDQESGRKGSARAHAISESKLTLWMQRLFYIGIGLMVTTALSYEVIYEGLQFEWKSFLLNSLLAFSGALLCLVPTLKLYLDTMAYDEHSKRYLRIGQTYIQAEKLLSSLDANDVETMRRVYLHLGVKSIKESCDWIMIHRQRPVKVPVM